MIRCVTGKPGGGKGTFFMRQMELEAVNTSRYIAVSPRLGLRVEQMMVYLLNKYGKDFNFRDRLILLTDKDCEVFWTFRKDVKSWFCEDGLFIEK